MEDLQKKGDAEPGTVVAKSKASSPKAVLALRIAMAVAAAALATSFFLPWGAVDEEYREAAASVSPDMMFYEPTGLTVSDAADLSLLEYAQVYGSMGGNGWDILAVIIYAIPVLSLIALLFAALGKPIVSAVFGVLALVVTRFIVWDFTERGVLPNGTHDWGIAPAIYLAVTFAIVVLAVALVVLKRRSKAPVSS